MSTALYRRYRPETFQEVIGQEHVTEPLMAALRADRATHAYLFSGPRGCGKTTSARIFARCLNCAQGPTDTPCGTCDSCVELARGGAGSLDVVEMDAASHGGVDDARDLRERASFAPARDRYKIFIIDEAHMVSPQGFNALLKLVEEPPEHVKFVFATTEPDKVIGTIRSRTHHYPFRLVPPERLLAYLEELCAAEGVEIGSGVLPMVVRAGGGSVRDSLSVLDQLIAGAVDGRLDHDRAVALLGYTDAALLDEVVGAVAARDGAGLFQVVDRVIESGHDPRRFVEDLLQRLRDLIVIAMAGEHAAAALRGVPADQLERMRAQAHHLGAAQISRAAGLTSDALNEMSGATSPRLQLELLCARILLPGADQGDAGYGARLDRIERQIVDGGAALPAAGAPATPAPAPASTARAAAAAPAPVAQAQPAPSPVAEPAGPSGPTPGRPVEPAADGAPPAPGARETSARQADRTPSGPHASMPQRAGAERSAAERSAGEQPAGERPAALPAGERPATGRPAPDAPAAAPASAEPGADTTMIRRRWDEVLATLRSRRSTWALVSQNAQPGEISGGALHLLFATPGLASTFRGGPHAENVQRALAETLGVQVRVDAIVDGGRQGPPAGGPPGGGAPLRDAVSQARTSWDGPARPIGSAARTTGQQPGRAPAGPEPSAPTPPEPPDDDPYPASAHGRPVGPTGAPAPATGAGDLASPNGTPARWPAIAGVASTTSGPSGPSAPSAARAAAARSAASAASTPTQNVATPSAGTPSAAIPAEPARPAVAPADDVASMDDPDAEGSGLVGPPLVAKILGGVVIEEIPLGPGS